MLSIRNASFNHRRAKTYIQLHAVFALLYCMYLAVAKRQSPVNLWPTFWLEPVANGFKFNAVANSIILFSMRPPESQTKTISGALLSRPHIHMSSIFASLLWWTSLGQKKDVAYRMISIQRNRTRGIVMSRILHRKPRLTLWPVLQVSCQFEGLRGLCRNT